LSEKNDEEWEEKTFKKAVRELVGKLRAAGFRLVKKDIWRL